MRKFHGLAAILFCLLSASMCRAAVWKAEAQIGTVGIYAEMNDAADPVLVMIRVENHSKVAAVSVSQYFVQLLDGQGRLLRPITADVIVSERLQHLRQLLPQNVHEIDQLLGEIRADYPQEKIVAVYARLKQFLSQNRPIGWRSQVENWLMGVQATNAGQVVTAEQDIQEIGTLATNYLWPRDVAPDSVYTGTLFFERPTKDPAKIFFQMGKEFIGTQMVLAESGNNPKAKKGHPHLTP